MLSYFYVWLPLLAGCKGLTPRCFWVYSGSGSGRTGGGPSKAPVWLSRCGN